MRRQTEPPEALRQMASRALRRPQYAAARAFYITILVIFAFAAWSLVRSGGTFKIAETGVFLQSRAMVEGGDRGLQVTGRALLRRDEECRLVHTAHDQCAFVRANCQDEEAGLLSYLQLYYCNLPKAKPLAFIILVLWLGLLFSTIGIAASDFFCINLSTIASILGMSESMAGVTFLAFGNGSPDVFSTFAAMKTHSGSLAVGELIGAAGFITAVVAGSMALVRPFKVARKSFVRDVGFFIVAASFSMVFLADGRLHMWECAVMVGFYVFYVFTVVFWHWFLGKRTRRKALEDAARSHFHIPGTDEGEVEPYHDDEDERVDRRASSRPSRTVSGEDFANLERAGSPMLRPLDDEADADDETRDRYLAEISSNMRVSRPKPGTRRTTINPIRPSLVGALEFRAVLSSLQKSRNLQTIPINLRRYSDDPLFTEAQQRENISRRASNPSIRNEPPNASDVAPSDLLSTDAVRSGPGRVRAVSTNDAAGLQIDSRPLKIPQIDLTATAEGHGDIADASEPGRPGGPTRVNTSQSEALTVSSPHNDFGYMASSPMPMTPSDRRQSGDLLAPPGSQHPGRYQSSLQAHHHGSISAGHSPTPGAKPSIPKLQISVSQDSSQVSSPMSPFPDYHDDPDFVPSRSRAPSIRLPPPSLGSESSFHRRFLQPPEDKPLRWWPYRLLPPPEVLVSTLFPTLYSWNDKVLWEKMLGVVAAPSVFLLAITLPIVEAEKDEDDPPNLPESDPNLLTPQNDRSRSGSSTLITLPPDSPTPSSQNGNSTTNAPKPSRPNSASPTINVTGPSSSLHQPTISTPPAPSSAKEWNRWLVATQIFTAPLFILLLVHLNYPLSNPLIPTQQKDFSIPF